MNCARLLAASLVLFLAACESSSVLDLPAAPSGSGSISGTVVAARPGEATRRPVKGAKVLIVGTSIADLTTEDGRFLLKGITQTSGTLLIEEPPGSGRAPRQRVLRLERLDAGPNRVVNAGELVLSENARVHGKARRGDKAEENSGHAGIVVFVPEAPFVTQTGDDGSYLLPDLPEGPVQIAFTLAGYEPAALDGLELRAGEELTLRDVLLGPGKAGEPGKLVAHVALEPAPSDSQPVVVTIVSSDGQVLSGNANATQAAAAEVTISDVPPAVYRVIVGRQGYATAEVPNVVVRSGETTTLPGSVVLRPPDDANLPPTCTDDEACVPADPCRVGAVKCIAGIAICQASADPRLPGSSCGDGYVCNAPGTCVACRAGNACTPLNRCHGGVVSCDTGEPTCEDDGTPAEKGIPCDDGKVCSETGECVTCADGAECEPGPCRLGSITCASGEPICGDLGIVAVAGTECGDGKFCDASGRCSACTSGASCTPPNRCRVGKVSCDTGAARCVDTGTAAPAGLECGANSVCDGEGSCGVCDAGSPCIPQDPCHEGAITCSSGKPECEQLTSLRDPGSACADGRVCSATGSCVACPEGDACEAGACRQGAITCTTGAPTCAANGLLSLAGTTCGEGRYCSDTGACAACDEGASCKPANTCRVGRMSCATGVSRCLDTGAPATAGLACGANSVCDGAGACAVCDAGAACVPTDPCHVGEIACDSGHPQCVDTGTPRPAGTGCGNGRVCSAAASCVACVAGEKCASPTACRVGAIACGTGAPVCAATTTLSAAGTSCGTDKVCDPDGVCAACVAKAACTLPNACHVGEVSCASGRSTCVDTLASVDPGTTCGAGQVCNASGACVACVEGAGCTPTNACHEGAIACASGAPVCVDTTVNVSNGTVCASGKVCKAGACTTCTAGASCLPANPCHVGLFSCSMGDAICTDTGTSALDGTNCGTAKVCKAGSCVPSGLSVITGDNQTGYTGQVQNIIQMQLLNGVGAPVVNEVVTFTVPAGAVAQPTSVATDASGKVSLSVRLPPKPGTYAIQGRSATGSTATATVTATEPPVGTIYAIVNTDHSPGLDGSGGPAFKAHLRTPTALTRGSDGTLYVADYTGYSVRKVSPDGVITTVVGTGASGDDAPGGLGSASKIGQPAGVALDEARGRLYVSDATNNLVRVLELSSGVLTVFAGGGVAPGPGFGDGGPALAASLSQPGPLEIGPDGKLYVGDTGNHGRIRRIDQDTTTIENFFGLAGASQNCTPPGGLESSMVSCANDVRGCSVTWDTSGNAYATIYGCGTFAGSGYGWAVQRLGTDGSLTHVLGRTTTGVAIDGTQASLSPVSGPPQLAFDAAGNLWFSDVDGHRLRKVEMTTGRARFVAGTGTADYFGDFAPFGTARFNTPAAVLFEPDGSLVVADRDNAVVRRLVKVGDTSAQPAKLAYVAGASQSARVSEVFGSPLSVKLTDAAGVALPGYTVRWKSLDAGGAIYGAVTPTNSSGVASNTVRAGFAPGTYRFEASFTDLRGAQAEGSPVTFTMTAIAPASGTIFLAADVDRTSGQQTGSVPATLGRVYRPRDLAVGPDGSTYIPDAQTHVVYRLTAQGQLTLVAGTPGSSGFTGDGGSALAARLWIPSSVAVAPDGRKLYVADSQNDRIREVDLSTGGILTLAGGGSFPSNSNYGDNGAATAAQLGNPGHLTIGPDGALYVSDHTTRPGGGTGRVRRIDLTSGIITEVAGPNGLCSGSINIYSCGGALTDCWHTWDAAGSMYVSGTLCGAATGNSGQLVSGVVKRAANGSFTHWAGQWYATPANGFLDGLTPALSSFSEIPMLVFDEAGNAIMTESDNDRMRRFDATTGLVSRWLGSANNTAGFSGDYVPVAPGLLMSAPWSPVRLPGGHWLFSDQNNSCLRAVW